MKRSVTAFVLAALIMGSLPALASSPVQPRRATIEPVASIAPTPTMALILTPPTDPAAPYRRMAVAPTPLPTVEEAFAWARTQLTAREYSCLRAIAWHESRDIPGGKPGAKAWGLFQAKPAEKMRSAGADWRTNPMTQVRWAITYARSRYGSFCVGAARKFGWCQAGRRTLIGGLDIPHALSPARPGLAGAECSRRHGVWHNSRGWW